MKENFHDIDKLFRAALEDQEVPPSSNVWDAIDKKLDKTKVVEINMKYLRLKKIALGLLVLLMGAGIYTLNTWKTTREMEKNEHNTNNDQNNKTRALTSAPDQQDLIIAQKSVDAHKTPEIETNNVTTRRQATNEFKSMPDITKNPALKNIPGSAGQAIGEIPTTPGGSKIIIHKKNQKKGITNTGFEEENGNGNASSVNNQNKLNRTLTGLLLANPQVIKSGPSGEIHKNIIPGNFDSPKGLASATLPNKIMQAKDAPSLTATVFFAPNIASNQIKDGKRKIQPGRPGDSEDKIRHGEQHQFSYTFGLLIDYNLNKHWSIQSGVSISNKIIRIGPKTIYADIDNFGDVKYLYNCSSGYLFLSSKSVSNPAVGDSIKAFESTNTLQYASIPLSVKYNYSLGRIDLFASIGVSLNILTLDKIETGLENGLNKEVSTTTKINGLKSRYPGANLSIGASYSITDKIAVSFMPSYNFALTSSTKDAMVKTYPNTISLAAGIRYKL